MVASNRPRQPNVSREQSPEDQLDVIPMKKTSPAIWIGLVVGALLVVGLLVFTLSGGSKDKAKVDELRLKAEQAAASAKSPEQLKAEREHLATTERALAAAEQQKKEQEAVEAEKKEEQAKAQPAAAGQAQPGAAPANPQATAKAKSDLDSIESQALKGLE